MSVIVSIKIGVDTKDFLHQEDTGHCIGSMVCPIKWQRIELIHSDCTVDHKLVS